jgi:nitrate reductase gamma subunit
MQIAFAIFSFGVAWRLIALVLLRYGRLYSEPRQPVLKALLGGAAATVTRSWPHREFIRRTGYGELLGYSYHIGLFAVLLLFGPHIAFFKGLFGVSWPALPSGIIDIVSVITLALLIAVLVRRITHRVLRLLSNFDDYFSWFVTTLVIVTGVMATADVGGPYEQLLAWHILSFELLLIWFPFGKLMHAFYIFPSRAIHGYLAARKGASW